MSLMVWLRCRVFGHRWRHLRVSLEGHRMWRCARCGEIRQGAYVGPPGSTPRRLG